MLNKLLKYDLKYMIINMSAFYILTIFFAITSRLLLLFEQTVIIIIINKISIGCLIAMIFNIVINTMMRSWIRFKDFIYKDEAYLTHTLPVTKKEIYESKFIQTIMFTFIGFIIIVISLFITYYTEERWLILKDLVSSISKDINIPIFPLLISIIVILFIEIINGIQSGYLGIILGHKKNNHKIGLSVIFGFISYIISQFFILLSVAIFGIFNSNIASLFTSNVVLNIDTIKQIIIFSIIIYCTIITLMNITCIKLLNKGINIE